MHKNSSTTAFIFSHVLLGFIGNSNHTLLMPIEDNVNDTKPNVSFYHLNFDEMDDNATRSFNSLMSTIILYLPTYSKQRAV